MILIGDLGITGLHCSESAKNHKRISQIQEYFSEGIVIANLECPIHSDIELNKNKNAIHSSCEEATRQILQGLKVDCVSIANNHIYDCTKSGLEKTIKLLDKSKIQYAGASSNTEDSNYTILHDGAQTIGFLAYVDLNTNPRIDGYEKEFNLSILGKKRIIEDIYQIKSKCDVIVCSLHWGNDYSHIPSKQQIELARDLIHAGCTIVMGHHPHTIQPYEYYEDGIILYSLGGLTFGDHYINGTLKALYRKSKLGLIAKIDLDNIYNSQFILTKENKGNYISIIDKDFNRWNRRHWRYYKWINTSLMFNRLYIFKESILDRVFEYFFGYYKNPVCRLFDLKNIRKFSRLILDYKRSRNKN